jgi:hypothetical protein
MNSSAPLLGFAGLLLAGCCCAPRPCCEPATAPAPAGDLLHVNVKPCGEFEYDIPFALGESSLKAGDAISISGLRGDRPKLEEGGSYCIFGAFTLTSVPAATLFLYSTNGESVATHAERSTPAPGTGAVAFHVRIAKKGDLHLSFYPVGSGSSLGGVYFGNR